MRFDLCLVLTLLTTPSYCADSTPELKADLVLEGHYVGVHSVAFSANGKTLADRKSVV